MSKKNKGFDPWKHTMDNASLYTGTLMSVGVASKLPSSPTGNKVIAGMGNMELIPRMHSVGGVFGSLGHLERTVKKKR